MSTIEFALGRYRAGRTMRRRPWVAASPRIQRPQWGTNLITPPIQSDRHRSLRRAIVDENWWDADHPIS